MCPLYGCSADRPASLAPPDRGELAMLARSKHPIRTLAAAVVVLLATLPLAAGADTVPVPGPVAVAVPASAVIHPGDTLAISVYGDQSLTQTAVVQADGTIQYPLAGRVLVAGMSAADARDTLATALHKYYHHPIVALAVQQQGQINVTVMGNVKNSGRYQMRNGARLSDAIAAAAGVATMNGEYPAVHVSQQDGSIATASLQKLLHDGDATQNVALDDNALVYVTGAETFRVQVLGAVSRPGNVEVNEGDRLSMALARAGAEASTRPDLSRIYLTRIDPATGKTLPSFQIDIYRALEKGEQPYDPLLRKNDKIFVPPMRGNSMSLGIFAILGRLLGL